MPKTDTQTMSRELTVNLINSQGRPELRKFRFSSAEGSEVNASELKQDFLSWFDESAVELEAEEETDENRSYHLLAYDETGKRHTIPDDATIDLNRFSEFEISPRTTGGGSPRAAG
jgi:hypothetical protein